MRSTRKIAQSRFALHSAALLRALHEHLVPGGRIALADLDSEEGDFHPPGTEGVYHSGFDRTALGALAAEAGFVEPAFVTACAVDREQKRYPVFLMTATTRA